MISASFAQDSFAKLLAELMEAREDYQKLDRRVGAANALSAVINFLGRESVPAPLLVPLHEFIGALSDAYNERNLKPHSEALRWARAAAAVDVVKLSGMSLSAAATEVSKATGRTMSPRALIEFRKNINKRRARIDAIKAYEHSKQKLFPAGDPKERAQLALHFVRDMLATPKKG